jgi:hypothetical protein
VPYGHVEIDGREDSIAIEVAPEVVWILNANVCGDIVYVSLRYNLPCVPCRG